MTAEPVAIERANRLESFSPATGEKLGEVAVSTAEAVVAAVARARRAQVAWADLGAKGRARILRRLKGVLIDRGDEIADVVSRENGKPRCEAVGLVLPICETVDLYTKLARQLDRGRRVSATFFFGSRAEIVYEPLGVAGFILPWNFPFELGMKQLLPALAAGNAVVQKPSEVNPLIGELVTSLFTDAGVPADVVQVVHGHADTGQALIDNVDAITFVGSPSTGRKVMARAASNLIPVVLELGGNDAAIVRSDADLDLTARGLVNGTCFNGGQVCNGIERIYVPEAIVEPLSERIIAIVEELEIAGRDGRHDIGPVTWRPQLDIYEEHTSDAIARGARLRLGGKRAEIGGGVYWEPTVLTGMNHDMLMMREETFGPFLPIMAVRDDDHAVELANDSRYGLGGSIWTRDAAVGRALARRIRTGSVMINNAVQSGGCVTLPFGGAGESGVGRVQGEAGLYNYLAPKSLMTSPRAAASLWMPYWDGAETMIRGLTKVLHGRTIGERIGGAVDFVRNARW